MASGFEYEDLMSENIESLKVHNNQYDSTGKLNELRLPPRRKQQAAARPKFYNPEQQYARALPLPTKFSFLRPSSSTLTKLTHAFQLNIPHLSATLSGPPTFSLTRPATYPIQITLTHHVNQAGNPHNKPVTFRLKDTALTEIDNADTYPWLLLLHVANDSGNHEGGR
jgi:hypothetical protein